MTTLPPSNAYSSGGMVLGQRVAVPDSYAPELLQRIERAAARALLPHEAALANVEGVDVWQAYEGICLTNDGLPVIAMLKICVPVASRYVVESKSLKLYLHSMMNERMGDTPKEAILALRDRIVQDLSALLEIGVQAVPHAARNELWDFQNYSLIDSIGLSNPFPPSVDIQQTSPRKQEVRYSSHLLRSRCPITGQPDWGDVFIHLQGEQLPNAENLRHYIVQLHNENHFHETICERIYTDLLTEFRPNRLMISCLYTRRGGIDISPCRATHAELLPTYLCDVHTLSRAGLRQ